MDINTWKSVAVRKTDYDILKGLCKDKFRAPASMISKLIHDYVEYLAKREKIPANKLIAKLTKKKN